MPPPKFRIEVDNVSHTEGSGTLPLPPDYPDLSKTFGYNVDGQLVSINDAQGIKSLSYDVEGKLESITGTGIYPDKAFAYDVDGNLSSITVS